MAFWELHEGAKMVQAGIWDASPSAWKYELKCEAQMDTQV